MNRRRLLGVASAEIPLVSLESAEDVKHPFRTGAAVETFIPGREDGRPFVRNGEAARQTMRVRVVRA